MTRKSNLTETAAQTAAQQIAALKAQIKALADQAKEEEEAKRSKVEQGIKEIQGNMYNFMLDSGLGLRMQESGLHKVSVEIGDDGSIKVNVNGLHKGSKGEGSGAPRTPVSLPEEGIAKKYKDVEYRLTQTAEGFDVHYADDGDGGLMGHYKSATAAAQAVMGNTKSINGRDWWKING